MMPTTRKRKTAPRTNGNLARATKTAKSKSSSLSDIIDIPTPDSRPLKCYAFDPSHGKFFGNEMTLEVKYEKKEALGQYLAAVYLGRGDKDRAFEWLEKDFEVRNGKLAEIRWQLQFDSIRDDPRYKDLLRRMGMQQ